MISTFIANIGHRNDRYFSALDDDKLPFFVQEMRILRAAASRTAAGSYF
jgi:hypothetical protein